MKLYLEPFVYTSTRLASGYHNVVRGRELVVDEDDETALLELCMNLAQNKAPDDFGLVYQQLPTGIGALLRVSGTKDHRGRPGVFISALLVRGSDLSALAGANPVALFRGLIEKDRFMPPPVVEKLIDQIMSGDQNDAMVKKSLNRRLIQVKGVEIEVPTTCRPEEVWNISCSFIEESIRIIYQIKKAPVRVISVDMSGLFLQELYALLPLEERISSGFALNIDGNSRLKPFVWMNQSEDGGFNLIQELDTPKGLKEMVSRLGDFVRLLREDASHRAFFEDAQSSFKGSIQEYWKFLSLFKTVVDELMEKPFAEVQAGVFSKNVLSAFSASDALLKAVVNVRAGDLAVSPEKTNEILQAIHAESPESMEAFVDLLAHALDKKPELVRSAVTTFDSAQILDFWNFFLLKLADLFPQSLPQNKLADWLDAISGWSLSPLGTRVGWVKLIASRHPESLWDWSDFSHHLPTLATELNDSEASAICLSAVKRGKEAIQTLIDFPTILAHLPPGQVAKLVRQGDLEVTKLMAVLELPGYPMGALLEIRDILLSVPEAYVVCLNVISKRVYELGSEALLKGHIGSLYTEGIDLSSQQKAAFVSTMLKGLVENMKPDQVATLGERLRDFFDADPGVWNTALIQANKTTGYTYSDLLEGLQFETASFSGSERRSRSRHSSSRRRNSRSKSGQRSKLTRWLIMVGAALVVMVFILVGFFVIDRIGGSDSDYVEYNPEVHNPALMESKDSGR